MEGARLADALSTEWPPQAAFRISPRKRSQLQNSRDSRSPTIIKQGRVPVPPCSLSRWSQARHLASGSTGEALRTVFAI